MAKEKKEVVSKYSINTELIKTDYRAMIDGSNIVIKVGQTEIPELTEEQIRQLLIAKVLIES